MNEAPRYPLILNPKAKSEKGARAFKFVLENATKFVIYASRSREDAIKLTRKFVAEGEPVVIAAGGDGTINAVIEGLAGSATTLGVLPTGTMNVFAREMGIPFTRLADAMDIIEAGYKKTVDLFEMNGMPFIQMAGIGFDAQVIEETSWESKKLLGPLAYVKAMTKVLGDRPPKVTITCHDGRVRDGFCAFIGNGSLYGGHFPLFRDADNADQLLDVVIFKEAGFEFMRDSLRGLARGGIDLNSPGDSVEYFQSAGLLVSCDHSFPVELDGELWGRCTEANFQSNDRTLEVFAPKEIVESKWLELLAKLNPFYRSNH